jgi:hypothetical protein
MLLLRYHLKMIKKIVKGGTIQIQTTFHNFVLFWSSFWHCQPKRGKRKMEGTEQGPEDMQVDGIEELSVSSEGFDFSVILFTIIVGAAVFYYFWNKV